ncbi:ferritin-like domain-containing protein [Alteribacillus bidgolensis]|uniref:Bacterioferritin n=1 Tax=Alteribacillus bidgolensis TaxID=930129 RepID=A0A1G8LAD7_9BACI|nr:ferritin-like domain-containing protein [Alteribacillus bidgolensis]SDI52160.1 bacterioferritin [Alteribacillus bidgolensis]
MDAKMKELIDGLNEDLANEYAAVIMYNNYAAVVSGLYRQVLKPFFEGEIADEQGHALYLAEKIKTLGGTPTTQPADVKQTEDVKEMLQNARQSEKDTIERYKTRAKQADELGLIELQIKLEDLIADETGHMEEMERLLADPRMQ